MIRRSAGDSKARRAGPQATRNLNGQGRALRLNRAARPAGLGDELEAAGPRGVPGDSDGPGGRGRPGPGLGPLTTVRRGTVT